MRQVIKIEIVQELPETEIEAVEAMSEEELVTRIDEINRSVEGMLESEMMMTDGSYARVVEHRLEK